MTYTANESCAPADGHDDGAGRDRKILAGYLAGNEEALGEVNGWMRAVLARKYPRLALDFDDLTQTVHERFLENIKRNRFAARSSLRAYVLGILHYTTLEKLREIYRQDLVDRRIDPDATAAVQNPYHQARARDRASLAHRVYHTLPARCRELWRLVYWEELSYTAVGEKLGIPPGTVKSRMWHCRRKALKLFRSIGAAVGINRDADA